MEPTIELSVPFRMLDLKSAKKQVIPEETVADTVNKQQDDRKKWKSRQELACLGCVIEIIFHEMHDRSPRKSRRYVCVKTMNSHHVVLLLNRCVNY